MSKTDQDLIQVFPFTDGIFDPVWSKEAVGQRRDFSDWYYQGKSDAKSRRRSARKRTQEVRKVFEDAEIEWPPAEIYLRAFKAEGELELWATSEVGEEMKPVVTWKLCALSGELGPKRQEGDEQVPEGFYKFNYYNPYSRYHLSMRVNYPNKSDRILGHPKQPGSDIMIHGKCASIGCLAMTDQRIEELWVIVEAVRGVWPRHTSRRRRQVPVTIFPSRYLGVLLSHQEYAQHHDLWRTLQVADLQFKRSHRPAQFTINAHGGYEIKEEIKEEIKNK
jgi:murein L,D-transpeptidase YafK